MFDLVAKVEDYPKFLPWCNGVKIVERTEDNLTASLQINFHGVKQSFTTTNHNQRPTQMKMHLVDGPFKMLEAVWSFKSLRADACKIDFDMQYEFSSVILEQIVGPVFGMIANTMVDSFCKRAEQVYGI
jgi:ribosome-associated toxin RatA of RatAB toxin-antitoxin module